MDDILLNVRAELDLNYLETDLDGAVVYINDALARLTGYSKDELLGKNVGTLSPQTPQWVSDDLWKTVRAGHPWHGHFKNRTRNGATYWVHATVSPIVRAGATLGYLFFWRQPDAQEIAKADVIYESGSQPYQPQTLRQWFSNLRLQTKIQILVQPILLIGGILAAIGVHSQMDKSMMENAQRRAEATAMQVIDSANMLMITGEISKPENRRLMVKKIIAGQQLYSLKLLRTKQVVQQFGPGLPEEHLDDPLVLQTIDNSLDHGEVLPYFALEMKDGKPIFRAITPYFVSHNFHGTDCLACHHVQVGTANGASDIEIDLSGDFARLSNAMRTLVAGQVLLQAFLFFFVGWVSKRFISRPIESIKNSLSEIVNGDYAAPLDVSGRDEMGELLCAMQTNKLLLGSAVNQSAEKMAEILIKKDLLERQSRVLENIILSHEKVSQWKEFVQEILSNFHSVFAFDIFYIAFAEENGLSMFIYYMNSYSEADKKMARTALTMGMLSKLDLPLDAALDIEEFQVRGSDELMPIGEVKMLTVKVPGENKVDLAGLLGVTFGSSKSLSEQEGDVIHSILAVMVMVVGSSKALSKSLSELEYYSTHDPLTGLYNRRYFNEMLEYELGRSERHKHEFSVLMIDLDNFKDVNDTYGHPCGDSVLRNIAESMHRQMRIGDLATRIGGDEFAIILSETGKNGAIAVAEKLRTEIRNIIHDNLSGKEFHVTISIGLATYPEDAQNLFDLMSCVDVGLYRAKEMGRDGISTVDSARDRVQEGRQIRDRAEQLRIALKDDRIVPYFQPIMDCKTGEVFAYESLARLREEGGEIVSAGMFIETVEKYGLGRELDRIMVEKSLKALKDKIGSGIGPRLFVNLSAQEIQGRGILGYAEQLCSTLEIPPSCVVFEILERDAIGDMTHMRKLLNELGNKGFSFALDDFGSGYNSFHYLRELHFEFVKLDGSFVRNILNSKIDLALVRNLSRLCHDIGTKTVAEFVESDEILLALKDMGVDYVQGFHLGMPRQRME